MAPARKPAKSSARVPALHGNHADNMRTMIARLATLLLEHRKDVATKMALVKETWSERAAIREYLGGYGREQAECLAIEDACAVLGVRYVRT